MERLTEPERRDRRLRRVLGPLLDVCLGLAAARILVLYELGIPLALLEGLSLLTWRKRELALSPTTAADA